MLPFYLMFRLAVYVWEKLVKIEKKFLTYELLSITFRQSLLSKKVSLEQKEINIIEISIDLSLQSETNIFMLYE